MKKRVSKDKIISKRSFKDLFVKEGEMEDLKHAWNNMPEDVTTEEKLIFIEVIEKTIRLYNKCRDLYREEEKMSRN